MHKVLVGANEGERERHAVAVITCTSLSRYAIKVNLQTARYSALSAGPSLTKGSSYK